MLLVFSIWCHPGILKQSISLLLKRNYYPANINRKHQLHTRSFYTVKAFHSNFKSQNQTTPQNYFILHKKWKSNFKYFLFSCRINEERAKKKQPLRKQLFIVMYWYCHAYNFIPTYFFIEWNENWQWNR
jgi:hypothetical protein